MSSSTESTVESAKENLNGPLWKYVIKHSNLSKKGGNYPFTCKFCHKNFNGSHSRVKAHLMQIRGTGIEAFQIVIEAQKREMSEVLAASESKLKEQRPRQVPLPPPSNVNSSLGSSYFPIEAEVVQKKRKSNNPLAMSFDLQAREQVDSEIVRLFYTSGLSFNVAKNPCYRNSYIRASQISGYVPPGYNALREKLLQKERAHVERMLLPLQKNWKINGVSLCSDGWTDKQKRSLINLMAASDNGAMFLRAINCEGEYKDKHCIAKIFTDCINEIGPENVVQVVTDNAPVCQAAGMIVEAVFPHIFWTPCVVHTLNLALKDVMESKSHEEGDLLEEVEQVVGWVKIKVDDVLYVKNYIVNHSMRLNMYNEYCSLKLLQVAETRFASQYVMLKRFKEVKIGLQQMVISPMWDLYKADDQGKARTVKEWILSDSFWEHVEVILAFMGPIYEMIRLTDIDRPCLHLVYEWWDSMIENVKNAIHHPEHEAIISQHCIPSRFVQVLNDILVYRWTKSNTPLHSLAHSLNPRFYSLDWLAEVSNRVAPHQDNEVSKYRKLCLHRLYPDATLRRKVIKEFAYFSMNMGDYANPDSLENRFHMEPIVWWGTYGTSTPTLQSLAFKLLRQPASSSCCERNWSTYSFIHSLKRNKLEPKRAQDLVYVHTNLRLLARRHPNYSKNINTMWDIAGDSFDVSTDGGLDTLEFATLSLDEPTLEGVLFDVEGENDNGDDV